MAKSFIKTQKIVYYGVGIGGKTTNILYIASQLRPPGKVISYGVGYFIFTDTSFHFLQQEGVPESVLTKLKPLLNKKIRSEITFWNTIEDAIGIAQMQAYRKFIGWYADSRNRTTRLIISSNNAHNIGLSSTGEPAFSLRLYGSPCHSSTDKIIRRDLLHKVHGVVFVVDSQTDRLEANIELMQEFEEDLQYYGSSLTSFPWVIQYNKRDCANILSIDQLEDCMNRYHVPSTEAIATQGVGVLETLQTLLQRMNT